jgi:hypothetical protein
MPPRAFHAKTTQVSFNRSKQSLNPLRSPTAQSAHCKIELILSVVTSIVATPPNSLRNLRTQSRKTLRSAELASLLPRLH